MPGKSVKNWPQYEAIRRENPSISKESAARITNASVAKQKATGKKPAGKGKAGH